MPRPVLLFVMVALAGCASTPAAVPEADHGAAIAACAAAVAAHVGKPVEAVTAAWTGAPAGGLGVVGVTDVVSGAGGERFHTCEVDDAGRVQAIRHPGA